VVLLLLSFAVGFVIAVPTMGPASAIIIRRVVGGQYRKGLAFAGGSILAEGLACLAAIWGLELALYTVPNLKTILEWGGAILLIGVGGYFLFERGPKKSPDEEVEQADAASLGGQTIAGFAVTAFNPTLIATWATVLGVVISTLGVELMMWQKWTVPLAVMLGEMAWFGLLILLARRFGAYVDEWIITWIIRGVGLLLVAIGAFGLVQKILGAW
jgi:threonine/homoserine/homoserine lactone efflux protein